MGYWQKVDRFIAFYSILCVGLTVKHSMFYFELKYTTRKIPGIVTGLYRMNLFNSTTILLPHTSIKIIILF